MDINESDVSSGNETSSTEFDTEAKPSLFLIYLNLFGLPSGVLLVVVPALTVIIIILKNRKLRRESSKIFYVNLLVTDVAATLMRWVFSSTIIILYLLGDDVNCKVAMVPVYTSVFATRLMFLPVVFDRFLHIALPFSYKKMFTTRRIAVIISSLWMLSLSAGILALVDQDYMPNAESGMCLEQGPGFPLLFLLVLSTQLTGIVIITITCIYLRYKIIHSKRFFNSVKKSTAEQEKAMKVGRLMENLEEQVKPIVSVFIAQGIDAVFNVFGIVFIILGAVFGSQLLIRFHIMIAIRFCQYNSHAVVYGLRDEYIRKEVMRIYEKIRGPKKSKVIMLNGQ